MMCIRRIALKHFSCSTQLRAYVQLEEGKVFIILTGFQLNNAASSNDQLGQSFTVIQSFHCELFSPVQHWMLLITSASFLVTLQQLFSCSEMDRAFLSTRNLRGEVCDEQHKFNVKIKIFCFTPINHSLSSPLLLSTSCLLNEQIETTLNLWYQNRYRFAIVLLSMIGDSRKNELKYEPIQRSIMIIKSTMLPLVFFPLFIK